MSIVSSIRERLATLKPEHLEIGDDSAKHAGHAGARGGGGHFRVTIVSNAFAGCSAMARHRLVYQALGDMMKHDIHAMSIVAKTPDEYSAR